MFKSLDEYHVDLSASGSTLNIPLENLILTYQQISTTALRITIAAKDTNAPVLTDIRRITIFNTSSIESPPDADVVLCPPEENPEYDANEDEHLADEYY